MIDELPDQDLPEAAQLLDGLVARHDPEDQALIDRWIRPHPHKRGTGEAVLAESYVPLYALVGYLEAVKGDAEQVAQSYGVPREAVDAALAHYRRYRALIDARIAANQPPED